MVILFQKKLKKIISIFVHFMLSKILKKVTGLERSLGPRILDSCYNGGSNRRV